jgi:hypothetical protein
MFALQLNLADVRKLVHPSDLNRVCMEAHVKLANHRGYKASHKQVSPS